MNWGWCAVVRCSVVSVGAVVTRLVQVQETNVLEKFLLWFVRLCRCVANLLQKIGQEKRDCRKPVLQWKRAVQCAVVPWCRVAEVLLCSGVCVCEGVQDKCMMTISRIRCWLWLARGKCVSASRNLPESVAALPLSAANLDARSRLDTNGDIDSEFLSEELIL